MRYDVIENTDLNIEKVEMKCDGEIAKGLCKPLPNKSFAFVLCGKSGSGKTNLAISLLKGKKSKDGKRKGYFKTFNHIIVCSPTLQSLQNNIFKDHPEEKMFEDFDNEFIDFVTSFTDAASENNETTLLYLDDIGSQLRRYAYLEKALVSLLQNRRHRKLSCLLVVQKFRDLPTGIRNNLTHLALFRPVNQKELEAVHEELLPIEKKNLPSFVDFVFSKKYNFLFVDMSLQEAPGFVFYKNFDLINFVE